MNIYVGNLPFEMESNELERMFSEYGSVDKAVIISDRDSGRSKGFGFVEMENKAEAQKAIETLNEKPINGRNIKVNEARPREDRPRNNNRY